MMEAQEMFRVSNKVSRPEKALILGFMAGSRGTAYWSSTLGWLLDGLVGWLVGWLVGQ